MLEIQTDEGVIKVNEGICQISKKLKQLYEESGTYNIKLAEIDIDVFESVKYFYDAYSMLEDSAKLQFDSSTTIENSALKTHYKCMPDSKLIAALDISSFLQIDPLTNLLSNIIAEKIASNHNF